MSEADRDALKVELGALTDPYASFSSYAIAGIARNALTAIEDLEVTAKVNYGLYKSATADLDVAEAKIAAALETLLSASVPLGMTEEMHLKAIHRQTFFALTAIADHYVRREL